MLKLSPRLERLKNRLYQEDYWQENPWYFADVNILEQDGYKELAGEPIPIRKAYAIQYVLKIFRSRSMMMSSSSATLIRIL